MKTIIIKRYELNHVLINNRILYNVNNIWSNDRPDDYEQQRYNRNTCMWIGAFHDNIKTLTIKKNDLIWMKSAFDIGCITGKFPNSYQDELIELSNRLEFPDPTQKYFIRTEFVSLKHGQHGTGPYENIKSIIESLVTSKYNHACINPEDDECKIYFIDWIEDYDEEKEFRVFVKNNDITAISIQNIYKINTWINSLNDNEIIEIIADLINYFSDNIREKLKFLNNYTMDIYYSIKTGWYFIEPNCFGAEYAAGSALFHWCNDYDLLNGNMEYIEFRYTAF